MAKQIVHLFVFDTLADWETGFAVAGINNPDLQKHPGRYCVQTHLRLSSENTDLLFGGHWQGHFACWWLFHCSFFYKLNLLML